MRRTTLKSLLLTTLLLASAGLFITACSAYAATRGVVAVAVRHPAPPPIRARVVVAKPVRPGTGYVWVAGHHVWRPGRPRPDAPGRSARRASGSGAAQARYVWVAGKWVKPPRGKTVWVAARYDKKRGVFIAGYWQ